MIYLFFFLISLFGMAFGIDQEPLVSPEEGTSRFFYEFIKMLLILSAMVSVLFLISWYLKRLTQQKFERTNEGSLIKVIESRSLSARSILYLLDVEGKSFIIGETPQGLVKLGEYPQETGENK